MIHQILILAKSRKFNNFCIAGIDIDSAKWMCLVSDNNEIDGAISSKQAPFSPLDIIKVNIIKKTPILFQPENYLVDFSYPIKKIKTIDTEALLDIVYPCIKQPYTYLFYNTNPFLLYNEIQTLDSSLLIAIVDNIYIFRNSYGKIKANFIYNNFTYNNISVTDPSTYKTAPIFYQKALIIISLPHNPCNEKYYKFVANIFPIN